MKRNDGFTLIELLITVAAGTLVSVAVISLLLLGMRIQRESSEDVKEQQTVRIVMSMLEKMAGSGEIDTIETTYDGWKLHGGNRVLFEYVATEQTVYTGEQDTGVALLTGLNNAAVTTEADGKILRLSFDTERGKSYLTRVYCRTSKVEEDKDHANGTMQSVTTNLDADINGRDPETLKNSPEGRRLAFLSVLADEYDEGGNYGEIQKRIVLEGQQEEPYKYYSEWYINGYTGHPDWNKDTPWCACFVSWAAVKCGVVPRDDNIKDFVFADVDEGVALFKDPALQGRWRDGSVLPDPGDYIFFDWSGKRKDAAHVGVVLDVDLQNYEIYTIEGNSSGRVAIRKYPVDARDIMGYGVLPQFLTITADN